MPLYDITTERELRERSGEFDEPDIIILVERTIERDDVNFLKKIQEIFPDFEVPDYQLRFVYRKKAWKIMKHLGEPPHLNEVSNYKLEDFIRLFKIFDYSVGVREEIINIVKETNYPDVRDFFLKNFIPPEDIWKDITDPGVALELHYRYDIPITEKNLGDFLGDAIRENSVVSLIGKNERKGLLEISRRLYGVFFIGRILERVIFSISSIDAIKEVLKFDSYINIDSLKMMKRESIIAELDCQQGEVNQEVLDYLEMLREIGIIIEPEEIVH